MKLTFLGAAGEVTGSCYFLQTPRARVLIDCGIFQGSTGAELKNRRRFSAFKPDELDAVVLTHAHLDHAGRLPLLVKSGYSGKVYCTPPTIPLTDLSLKDSAHLMEQDWQRRVRKKSEIACPPGQFCGPLFNEQDVTDLVRRMNPVAYNTPVSVAPGVSVTFVDAGHIIGSASLIVRVENGHPDGSPKTIVFSGDVGEPGAPFLHDPTPIARADALVLESTYGDRDHQPLGPTIDELHRVVESAKRDGGKVLIPAFAIGRTQTLLYHLAPAACEGKLGMPVIVDSPMGAAVTRIYQNNRALFDEQACNLIDRGCDPLRFPGLRFTASGQESRALNDMKGPAIIVAGAGMCNGGRIVHHLSNHIEKPDTHVVIAGYQAEGTLGRRLVNREPRVKIFGLWRDVKAQVHTLGGFSAHAGRTALIAWAGHLLGNSHRPALILTHGEDKPRAALRDELQARFGVRAVCPTLGQSLTL